MFNLHVDVVESVAATLARAISVLLDSAPLIGRVTDVSLSTFSDGEDAVEWNYNEETRSKILAVIATRSDASGVTLTCDLECVDVDSSKFTIYGGMSFWIDCKNLADPSDRGPLEVTIALDTDVYAGKSWGKAQDNQILSRLNAPRFNRFLSQFIAATLAGYKTVYADSYEGQVGPDGFVVP